ncbi:MAG: hypothetical protein WCR47_07905, partial [Desulfoplanes sp.]
MGWFIVPVSMFDQTTTFYASQDISLMFFRKRYAFKPDKTIQRSFVCLFAVFGKKGCFTHCGAAFLLFGSNDDQRL